MKFINNIIVKLWYIWIVMIAISSFVIFSAINIKKMQTNRIEECMNIYNEYEDIRIKYRDGKDNKAEKEKTLKEYLTKLEKSYDYYKDLEYSDYLLLRQAEVLEELNEKDKAFEIYKKLDNSQYDTMPSIIANLVITRTHMNKETWEKEILKNIYRKSEPKLVIITKDITLKISLKYAYFPDNTGFLINLVRDEKIKKVKVVSIDNDFIDLKIEGELLIPRDSYIKYEKPENKEFAGKSNFVMFKTSWEKNAKPKEIDYSTLRICKKCELQYIENYSVLGEVDIETSELNKLKVGDENISLFLEDAELKVPMPVFLRIE